MAKKESTKATDCCDKKMGHAGTMSSGIYGLAFIGAVFYFIQSATSFTDGLYGILKAIFWPAILVYKAFQLLGM